MEEKDVIKVLAKCYAAAYVFVIEEECKKRDALLSAFYGKAITITYDLAESQGVT